MPTTSWWQDFRYAKGVVHVKKTGIGVPLGRGVAGEFMTWLVYYGAVEAARAGVRGDGPRIWFTPDRPRPWYLVWPVLHLAGLRLASRPEEADLAFVFEDTTRTAPQPLPGELPVINAACLDVSKSRVASVFEQVFDRTLSVDPARFDGPVVRKSESNGVHDGAIVEAPQPAEPGFAYQRLIDNTGPDGLVEDLRCPTIGGEIPLVFIKRRERERRFANANAEVRMTRPEAVFSAGELDQLGAFCRAMGLGWGGLDVLRDRVSGEIFVVDVNKTDMGPPIALPLKDKMAATRTLAHSLRAYTDRLAGKERS